MGPERSEPDRIIVTGLDWATGEGRVDEFQQDAYLVRSHLSLKARGVGLPILALKNDADERDGGGLIYRPPTGLASGPVQMPFFRIKPSYLAAWYIRRAMAGWTYLSSVELMDALPQQSRCLLFQTAGSLVAGLWRSSGGSISMSMPKSVRPVAAVNGFGHSVDPGNLRLSAMPVLLTFKGVDADTLASTLALTELGLPGSNWGLVEHLNPTSDADRARLKYAANADAKPETRTDFLPGAGKLRLPGLMALKKESFVLEGRPPGELFLRKRYLLTGEGSEITVLVNGKEAGLWNLRHDRSVPTVGGGSRKLPGGFRDAYFHLPAEALTAKEQRIELVYKPAKAPQDNNSFGYWLLSAPVRTLRLTQLGPIYAVAGRGRLQFDRNIAAGPLAIGGQEYGTGLGTHSPSLIEYPLGGQFKRFRAKVGIDRLTEGRGSAAFEVHGDGKLLFKSPVLSGHSKPVELDLDVSGVGRLTLVVKDGDDGSTNDYANWCDAELEY